jgi:hypothetical protein
MAGYDSALTIDSTPGWRVALLFIGIVVISVVVNKLTHLLEDALRHRRGLSHAVRNLKGEIYQLGVISLLLIGFQVGKHSAVRLYSNSSGIICVLTVSVVKSRTSS